MEFYHINHVTPYTGEMLLQLDDLVETSAREYNPFYTSILNGAKSFDLSSEQSIPILEFFSKVSDGAFQQIAELNDPKNIATFANIFLDQYLKFCRETHFENIRRKEFPELPSRTRCIWLAKSYEDALYWKERLTGRDNAQILRVHVSGNIFTTFEGHLIRDSEPYDITISRARDYWSGKPAIGKEEILFEGTLKVLEVM